jgi:hypothetical protein
MNKRTLRLGIKKKADHVGLSFLLHSVPVFSTSGVFIIFVTPIAMHVAPSQTVRFSDSTVLRQYGNILFIFDVQPRRRKLELDKPSLFAGVRLNVIPLTCCALTCFHFIECPGNLDNEYRNGS